MPDGRLAKSWLPAIGLVIFVWLAIIVMLEPTGSSMMAVWDNSETYTHGYVILPLSLWLIWRIRNTAMSVSCVPDRHALFLVLILCSLWLAASVAGVQVVSHYTLVGLLITAVWALLGRNLVWALLFPLSYLLFMVPSGDSLIDPLVDFTADFTIHTLRLLGIPVFSEGTFFSLPSGNWSVVEACSGIRYFFSSIVLGWLFAYLTYRTWWKRLAFGFASLVVPIIANGFRAVIIVLIGHYSSMTLAVGVDHLIYGWVWFGVVMLSMFWVGTRWREDLYPEAFSAAPVTPPRPAWAQASVLLAMVALFPIYGRHLANHAPADSPLANLTVPAGWQPVKALTDWEPHWAGMDDLRILHVSKGPDQVMVYLTWYGTQRQGAELINSQNQLVPEKHEIWRKTRDFSRLIPLADGELPIRQAFLDSYSTGQHLLVWYWNRIGGSDTTNIFKAKLMLAWRKLTGQSDAGAGLIIAAPYVENPKEAEAILLRFVKDMRPIANSVIDKGAQ